MYSNLIFISLDLSTFRLHTPPGTKFVVTNDIPVEEDLLMLGPGVLKNIGGHVEAMVNEWKASKVKLFATDQRQGNEATPDTTHVLQQFITRSAGMKGKNSSEDDKEDDTPPPFVPYKITNAVSCSIMADAGCIIIVLEIHLDMIFSQQNKLHKQLPKIRKCIASSRNRSKKKEVTKPSLVDQMRRQQVKGKHLRRRSRTSTPKI
jgi:hypothetical protein